MGEERAPLPVCSEQCVFSFLALLPPLFPTSSPLSPFPLCFSFPFLFPPPRLPPLSYLQIKDMDDVIGRDIPQLMARTPGLMDPEPEADNNPFSASAANPFASAAAPSSAPGVGWAVSATDK